MKKQNLSKKVSKIAVVILLIALCFTMVACKNDGEITGVVDDFYKSWMSNIVDEAYLKDIAIVGTHDSGTVGTSALFETQGSDLYSQLNYGARYFDLRVKEDGGALKIYHGDTDGFGEANMLFEKALADITKFIAENPSEFLILDFQHIHTNVGAKIIGMLTEKISVDKMLDKTTFPKLKDVKMEDIRKASKNYVVIWRVEETCASEDYLYYRGSELLSPYKSAVHSGSDEGLIKHYPNYYNEFNEDKLFVLQAQKTGKAEAPLKIETSYRPKINAYVRTLADSEYLDKINIIMRDYLTADIENVSSILSLNIAKKLVKPEAIETFRAHTVKM